MFQRRKPRSEDESPPDLSGGTVTALKSQVRDPERVSVFIDDQFAFGIAAATAVSEGIRIGDDLDAARVAALVALDDVGRATGAALNLLARRPRSTREISDRLKQKGFTAPAIEAAITKLEGWNYLDDADFARYWVENREANRPRGRRLLEQELQHKGVDREVAREAVNAAAPDERTAALALARSKARSYSGLDPAVAKRRLAGYLGRRGYGFDVISPTIDRVFGDVVDDELVAGPDDE